MKKLLTRPTGCLTPNELAKKLDITGEAIKQWIYAGKIKAAKAPNGYWWVRESDLKDFLDSHTKLEFKYHRIVRPKGKVARKS